MYIEDVLIAVAAKLAVSRRSLPTLNDEWGRNFIASVSQHVRDGKTLSANQARVVLQKLKRARAEIVRCDLIDAATLDAALLNPNYKNPPSESVQIPREVRHLGDNRIAFRGNGDRTLLDKIKALGAPVQWPPQQGHSGNYPRFNWTHKIWVVSVHHYNLDHILGLIKHYRFNLDYKTRAYLDGCRESRGQPTTFSGCAADPDVIIAHVADDDLMAAWIVDHAEGIAL